MTKEECMSKNINLAFDFVDYLIKNPSETEKIPNGSHIRFIDNAEKEETRANESEKVLKVRKVYEFS